jgi:hypothetical protein
MPETNAKILVVSKGCRRYRSQGYVIPMPMKRSKTKKRSLEARCRLRIYRVNKTRKLTFKRSKKAPSE